MKIKFWYPSLVLFLIAFPMPLILGQLYGAFKDIPEDEALAAALEEPNKYWYQNDAGQICLHGDPLQLIQICKATIHEVIDEMDSLNWIIIGIIAIITLVVGFTMPLARSKDSSIKKQ